MTMRITRSARRAGTALAVTATAAALTAGLVAVPAAHAQTPATASAEVAPGDVVLSEAFDDGTLPDGWNAIAGDWKVADGRLVGTSGAQDAKITFGSHLKDFAFDVDVRFEQAADSARWLSLLLDAPADGSHPWQQAALRNGSNAANGVEFAQRTPADAWNVTDTGSTAEAIGIGTDAHLRVEVRGGRGTWFVDGVEIMSTRQLVRTQDGVMGLIANRSTVSFDNVEITALEPAPPIDLVQPGDTGIVAAHRGNSSVAPENTMPAFVSASRAGADLFEIDIALTKDGVPVVIHDDTVDRTTDGSGAVRDLTLEQIRALDAGSWFSDAFAGTRIPTLDEVLTYVAGGGADLLLEYKGDWDVAQTQMTVDMINAHGVADRTFAQSFSALTVGNIAAVAPDLTLGWLVGELNQDVIDRGIALGADAVNPNSVTAESVAAAHASGVGVFVWTVDNAQQWQTLTAYGVDGIITNRPDQLVGWNLRYNQHLPEEPEQPEEPGENEQLMAVEIPEGGPSVPSGEFTWRFSSQDVVSLGTATALGDSLVAQGALNDILVTDTRSAPAGVWALTAKASGFVAGEEEFSAESLGWSPFVKHPGADAQPGKTVRPGENGGLSVPSLLASSDSDEFKGTDTATIGAGLDLRLPVGQAAGDYTSTLTITVVQ
ncbi:glycerophosphodiester phosphodiesterase family protein [Microbacterium resistens]